MVADGLVTGFCVLLLHKVRPSALDPAGAGALS
jgi:hypothetical protein